MKRVDTKNGLTSRSCHTAQINSESLHLFHNSTILKNLEIVDLFEGVLQNLMQLGADLNYISLSFTGDWKQCVFSVLKGFSNIIFLEIRVQDCYCSEKNI